MQRRAKPPQRSSTISSNTCRIIARRIMDLLPRVTAKTTSLLVDLTLKLFDMPCKSFPRCKQSRLHQLLTGGYSFLSTRLHDPGFPLWIQLLNSTWLASYSSF
ncbi:LOW QUALITY PROTEIN: hypothetical protein MKX08_005109 [Trichoderma sp. CBMAI-0020]|nr:LOW QUALITY PROTEIN: hypothetical protein MKX08_005109 [Trichoderma sp. CBMAI-0020]